MRSLSGWIGCAGLYVLLAGTTSASELVIGAVLGGLVVAFSHALARVAHRPLGRTRPNGLLHAIAQVPADTIAVGVVLARVLRHRPAGAIGRIQERPFESPETRAARGLETLARSLAPRGIAVQPRDDALRLHTLGGSEA